MGTAFKRTESVVCDVQAGCDGNYIPPKRLQAGHLMCGACEKVMAKRQAKPKALKGERYMQYEEER